MLVLHHKSLLAQFLPSLSGKPEKTKIICDFNISDSLLDLV
jgi:hypothetical protein